MKQLLLSSLFFMLLAAGSALAQVPTFGGMSTYAVADGHDYFAATGDLNGDGVLDLVSSNTSNLSVLLGRAAGGFAPAVNYYIAGLPEEVALADLNGDSKLDVVVAASGTVKVLLGNGNGTLGPVAFYAAGVDLCFSLKLCDVTGDGLLDAVTANIDNLVSVLPGTGTGGFGPATNYPVGKNLRGLSVADFNGDNRADIVVSDITQNTVYVLLGQANGFAAPASYPVGQKAYFLETADLNHDGSLDIIVSGTATGVKVLAGNANGTFQAAATYPVLSSSSVLTGLTTGDVNGDGLPDVLVADGSNGKVYVLPGSVSGPLGAPVTLPVGMFPYDISLADFNYDGRPDLLVANALDSNVGVLFNATTFPEPTLLAASPASGAVGTSVLLTGANLLPTTAVSFNGTVATTFKVQSATTLVAVVPAGATNGPVSVVAATQRTSGLPFAVVVGLATAPGSGVAKPTLYPNPAPHTATLTGTSSGQLVQVYDARGSLALTTHADNTGTAELPLPAGLYLVRIATGPALRLVVE